jgi:hypothetical protein
MTKHGALGAGVLLMLLVACVSSTPARVPEALRGCWVHHGGIETRTMRWFPKEGGGWRGDQNIYRAEWQAPAHQAFLIDATAGERERFGWAICPLEDGGLPHGAPCKALYFGHGPKITDDSEWMEIRAAKDRLTFDLINGGTRKTLFDGVRDGCD